MITALYILDTAASVLIGRDEPLYSHNSANYIIYMLELDLESLEVLNGKRGKTLFSFWIEILSGAAEQYKTVFDFWENNTI